MLTLNVIRQPTLVTRQEIRMDQIPTQNQWSLVPLYRETIDGNPSIWQIGFDGVNHLEITDNTDELRTEKITVEPQHALLEAHKRYRAKFHQGYQPAGPATAPVIKGMKGYDYTPNSVKSWPVYTQTKIHGIRMLCQYLGRNGLSMKSWLNTPYTHLKHIETELSEFFEYLPRYAVLDGELYNHNLDFSTLTSAVRTTTSIHPLLHMVQYHIFDIHYEDSEGTPFEKRYALLVNAFRHYIRDRSQSGSPEDISGLPRTFMIVPTQIARNHEEVIQQHNRHVASGYEGIMIKKISNGSAPGTKNYEEALYHQDKCNHILKYKQFFDEEVIIIGYAEVEGIPMFAVRDKRGNTFDVKMRGDSDRRNLLYQSATSLLGKELTIRYQEFSSYGVPKDPIGVSIRDYE